MKQIQFSIIRLLWARSVRYHHSVYFYREAVIYLGLKGRKPVYCKTEPQNSYLKVGRGIYFIDVYGLR